MKVIRWLAYSLIGVALLAATVVVGARFHDGPIEIIAGGPFTSGEIVSGLEPDWGFVRAKQTVELQLQIPARSRTTWIIEHQGKIYIPCGYMNTAWGKIWKKWPIEAVKNGRAVLRIGGKRYQRHLVRVTGGPALQPVVARLAEKYNVPATVAAVESNSLWLFELQPAREG